jgi:hypothetical protein
LACGKTDEEIYASLAKAMAGGGIFDFAAALIGEDYLQRGDEFGDLATGRLPKQYGSIPQIGSTAMMAGGAAGEIVARMALGKKYHRRFIIDPSGEINEHWGELV